MAERLPFLCVLLLCLCAHALSQTVDGGPTCADANNVFHCNCDASHDTHEDGKCRWKRVFKAVSGNGKGVYQSFLAQGGINADNSEARTIASDLVFRDDTVLDRWNQQRVISKVRIDLYEKGVRKAWFLYDGIGSTIENWMSKDRLLASPYQKTKEATQNFHSIAGDPGFSRHFFINRNYGGCPRDCGFLVVVDPGRSASCKFDKVAARPIILYGMRTDQCSKWNDEDSEQFGQADRFVISVKECSGDW